MIRLNAPIDQAALDLAQCVKCRLYHTGKGVVFHPDGVAVPPGWFPVVPANQDPISRAA